MSTTYHAKKQKKGKSDPQLSLALFAQRDGKPFSIIDPIVIATATYHSCANNVWGGGFANNLACAKCGKCALHLKIITPQEAGVNCQKCGRTEEYSVPAAIDFFWLHQKGAPRTEIQEDGDGDGETPGRVELKMSL